jgi:hypothetical protein
VVIDDIAIGAALSRNLGCPTASGEATEAELDRLITRRHDARVSNEVERTAEEMWQESECKYTERRREEMRTAWCEHHQGQAVRLRAVLESLTARHEEQAERYRNQPEGSA